MIEVTEEYVPLDGDHYDDARSDFERRKQADEGNANVKWAGIVETRSLAHRTPRTTAKWCALVKKAKRV